MLTVASATADTILQAYIADEEIKKLRENMPAHEMVEVDKSDHDDDDDDDRQHHARDSEMTVTDSRLSSPAAESQSSPYDELFKRKWQANSETESEVYLYEIESV